MFCLKPLLFLIPLFAAVALAASEEPAETSATDARYSGKQSQDWEKIQVQLAAQKTKLEAQENLVQGLAAEKARLSGAALTAKVEELKAAYAKLQTMADDYNRLNDEYLTRFPERGLKEKRIYTRVRPRTLKSYEDDQSVRGRVNAVHKKILKQYKSPPVRPAAKPVLDPPAAKKEGGEPAAPDVTDPIQLKK